MGALVLLVAVPPDTASPAVFVSGVWQASQEAAFQAGIMLITVHMEARVPADWCACTCAHTHNLYLLAVVLLNCQSLQLSMHTEYRQVCWQQHRTGRGVQGWLQHERIGATQLFFVCCPAACSSSCGTPPRAAADVPATLPGAELPTAARLCICR